VSALDPFVALLHALLVHLSSALPGPSGLGVALALVLLTIALRLAMLPLSLRAFRSQRARAALAPEIVKLKKRYGLDRDRLGQELLAAHQRAGVRPFAGMGSMLAQAPVMTTLYRLVTTGVVAGHANVIATVSLLSAPLSGHWLPVLATSALVSGPVLLALLLGLGLTAVAVLQYRRQQEGPALLRLLPFGSVAFAAVAPVAFSIYLLTSTAWTLVERGLLPRLSV
jgi:YidC/Oxa1 family membrane protein insertase